MQRSVAMKLLAYDTSSEMLTAAIFDGTKKIAELELNSFARHSSILVPSLEKLLKDRQINLNQIEALAVGLGPGSFTGLRVGITVAKIFAYVYKIKIIGVSSLEAIALGAAGYEGEIAVILDAKKEKLYAGVFEIRDRKFKVIQNPRLVKIEVLLKGAKKPRLFLGNGVKIYREQILRTSQYQIAETADSVYPKASHIAERAINLIKKKKWIDPFRLEPLYLHSRDCNATLPLQKRIGLPRQGRGR